jgi:hypothetical protein
VRRAYKFAYSEGVEVGPVACLPEPPDPNELYPRQSRRFVQVLAFSLVWTIIMEQIIVRC